MSQFELSKKVNPNKVFILKRSDIEKRLDPFYYVPTISELERIVRKHNPKPLRNYVISISSGATPKTTESEKYYSDKENGIPFLRVQNLSPTGFLQLDNCKYINNETHENYLKRSQVSGSDLLIKITGVGRMAVSSVAPSGFIGNTNQHMVVVKTESKKASTILAAYLNTDIGERLASRRATGGTRPALDYPALLSIPIIYDERILEITKKAILAKQQKVQQAQDLLASIDVYLLGELGITIPEKDNSLENRIFKTPLNILSGNRFDGDYYMLYYSKLEECIEKSVYQTDKIDSVVSNIAGGKTPSSSEYSDEITDYPIIKVGSYTNDFIDLAKVDYTKTSNVLEAHQGDIFILSAAHQAEYVGRHIKYLDEEPEIPTSYVGELICVRADMSKLHPMYLFSLLNTELFKTLINREKTGQTSHVYGKDIKHIKLPLPLVEKQNEIAEHIQSIRIKAKQLQSEATEALEKAKKEVEQMILG